MKRWGRMTITILVVGLVMGFASIAFGRYNTPPVEPRIPQMKAVHKAWVSGQLVGSETLPRNLSGVPVVLEYMGSIPYRQVTYTDGEGKFFFIRSLMAPKGTYRLYTLGRNAEWCKEVIFEDNAKTSHFFTISCTPPPPKWRER